MSNDIRSNRRRSYFYKVGSQMKGFPLWSETGGKESIDIWSRNVIEEFCLKHIPREFWEIVNLQDPDAKDWYRIALVEHRRTHCESTPDFAEILRMMHDRFAGKYGNAELVRKKQGYNCPSNTPGAVCSKTSPGFSCS